MVDEAAPGRFGPHYEALGFLRLLFASLVIVAHTPDLIDGNAGRDLLIRAIGGRLTSGAIAVSGFFIISGFLITGSYLSNQDAIAYVRKRIARIYPAFGMMFLICLFVVRPIGGGAPDSLTFASVAHEFVRFVTLQAPVANGAFASLSHPSLNGAVWTLPYELFCYVLVLGLSAAGLLSRAPVIAAIAALTLFLSYLGMLAESNTASEYGTFDALLYAAREPLRLIGFFFCGGTFFLVQRRIYPRRDLVAVAVVGLIVCLCMPHLANFGIALFGTYLIFAFAQMAGKGIVGKINRRNDISYGLYIYAWPIEQILIMIFGGSSLLFIGAATWLLAAGMGWLSWILLERPIMRAVRDRKRPSGTDAATLAFG